jgi:hypothetical protein
MDNFQALMEHKIALASLPFSVKASNMNGGAMSTGKIIGYIVAAIILLFGVLWLLSAFSAETLNPHPAAGAQAHARGHRNTADRHRW